MSFVNNKTREINCKIVYYGPGFSGKTTNLQYVYLKTQPNTKGDLVSLDTENERTIFFDFLPLELGEIRGYRTRFHLYTVPGQSEYDAPREIILRGVDGVIFVADSQIERVQDNIKSFQQLKDNLARQGLDWQTLPIVFQYNKRDFSNISTVDELRRDLNARGVPDFEAVANKGVGVFESLKSVTKLVLRNIESGMAKTLD